MRVGEKYVSVLQKCQEICYGSPEHFVGSVLKQMETQGLTVVQWQSLPRALQCFFPAGKEYAHLP